MSTDMQELTLHALPVTLTTLSPEETEGVGAALARLLEGDGACPTFIAMYGDLGVGKTAFVRGWHPSWLRAEGFAPPPSLWSTSTV